MPQQRFTDLLKHWESDYQHQSLLVSEEISLRKGDAIKLHALAKMYGISKDEVAAELMHQALNMIEEQMPYVAGDKVVRVEEGEEIYQDIGPMPRYLAAKKSLGDNE